MSSLSTNSTLHLSNPGQASIVPLVQNPRGQVQQLIPTQAQQQAQVQAQQQAQFQAQQQAQLQSQQQAQAQAQQQAPGQVQQLIPTQAQQQAQVQAQQQAQFQAQQQAQLQSQQQAQAQAQQQAPGQVQQLTPTQAQQQAQVQAQQQARFQAQQQAQLQSQQQAQAQAQQQAQVQAQQQAQFQAQQQAQLQAHQQAQAHFQAQQQVQFSNSKLQAQAQAEVQVQQLKAYDQARLKAQQRPSEQPLSHCEQPPTYAQSESEHQQTGGVDQGIVHRPTPLLCTAERVLHSSLDGRLVSPDVLCEALLCLDDVQFNQLLATHQNGLAERVQQDSAAERARQDSIAAAGMLQPQCQNRHACMPSERTDELYPDGLYTCDMCAAEKQGARWHCSACLADMCFQCTFTPQTETRDNTAGPSQELLARIAGHTSRGALLARGSAEWSHRQRPVAIRSSADRDRASPTRNHRAHEYKSGSDTQAKFQRVRSYKEADGDEQPGVDPWEGKRIVMKKGKYEGRGAFVKSRVNRKYRVMVDGVHDQLEFYPTSFAHCPPAIHLTGATSAPAV